MTYEQEKRQITKALGIIESLNVTGTQPYDFLIWIETIHKALENMKLDASKIDLVDMYEPIVVDLRLKLNELEIYYRPPDSETRKNEMLRLLDSQIDNFKEIRKIKREMEGLDKQDEEITLAEEAIVIAKESNVIAKDSKKIAFWAIVIACLGSIIGMSLTIFLHFR